MTAPTVAMPTKIISVGLGEMTVVKGSDSVLACLGLGSCIGVAAYDSTAGVSGMIHVVLPEAKGRKAEAPAKFADLAIPALLQKMLSQGAMKSRLSISIAGGAQMALLSGSNPVFKIGEQNLEAVKAALKSAGLALRHQDTGGNRGRTLRLHSNSGEVTVSTAGDKPKVLQGGS
jgi:chemotaxis protein CheD